MNTRSCYYYSRDNFSPLRSLARISCKRWSALLLGCCDANGTLLATTEGGATEAVVTVTSTFTFEALLVVPVPVPVLVLDVDDALLRRALLAVMCKLVVVVVVVVVT